MTSETPMNSGKLCSALSLLGFKQASRTALSILSLVAMFTLFCAGASLGQAPSPLPGTTFRGQVPSGVGSRPPITQAIRDGRSARAQSSSPKPSPQSLGVTDVGAQYSYVTIEIPNTAFVQPNSINNLGVAAGYYGDANYALHGFVWQNGLVQVVDYPGAIGTELTGVNNRGIAFGTYWDSKYNTYTFTYSIANATWTVLPAIPGTWQDLFGYGGINDRGEATGCAFGFYGTLSWIWHPDSETYSYYTVPDATEAGTCGLALNNGRVAGVLGTVDSYVQQLFIGKPGERFLTTVVPPSLMSAGFFPPFNLNASDTLVGTWAGSNSTTISGFMLTRSGAFSVLNVPGADQTYLAGINDSGVLCGNIYYSATGASPGFIAYPLH